MNKIEKDFKPLNVKAERITFWDFDEKLDYYFSNSDYLFLFDVELIGDQSTRFYNRVNIVYAKHRDIDIQNPRIWFYTIAGEDTIDQMERIFKERIIDVIDKNEYGIDLDFSANELFLKACEE